jgi:predicted SprT family Zn-dependent metalloprotease
MISAHTAAKPTAQTYQALQTAYDHFNRELFGHQLPDCLITLQRKDKRMYGYFWASRFAETGGAGRTDEIAMNPQRFTAASIEAVLSTLAHEMAHLWQQHFGKPSRAAYHNKEWAAKMKAIGLQPSDTGAPGGKETGQRMTHYIVPGGAFAIACGALLSDGFRLAWGEVIDAAQDDDEDDKNKSNRVKYTCPGCGVNAWGKPDLALICGDCEERFESA